MKNGRKLLASALAGLTLLTVGGCQLPTGSGGLNKKEEEKLLSLTVEYEQDGALFVSDSLNDLKEDVKVIGNYNDGSKKEIENFALSGTLSAGSSTITVSFGGKTATFTVEVSAKELFEPVVSVTQDGVVKVTTKNTNLRVWFDIEEMVVKGNSYSRSDVPTGWTVYARSKEDGFEGETVKYFIGENYELMNLAEDFATELPKNFKNIVPAPTRDGSRLPVENTTVSWAKEYRVDATNYLCSDGAGCAKIEKDLTGGAWKGWSYTFDEAFKKGEVKKIGIRFLEYWWELTGGYVGLSTDKGDFGGPEGIHAYGYYQKSVAFLSPMVSLLEPSEKNTDGFFGSHNRSMILWIDVEAFLAANPDVTEITGCYMGFTKFNEYYIDSIIYC